MLQDPDEDYEDSITIESKMPPITEEAKEKAKQAKIDFLQIYTKALSHPTIGDWLLRQADILNLNFQLYVNWIPSPDELKIEIEERERDPFITADIYDRTFLIAKWDVKGEEPFEHYLKEYKKK
ncbi:hypothetical protein DRJ25_03105 [Candidatus Woesearchaeota archaeon]|nr:MAG: hypothetical protein DRJ25_03105 [Candidatus Woesearchaeota archaeon]